MHSTAIRVMVIEDDFLLAGTLADVLTRLGCKAGPCIGSFDQAMEAALDESCDLAVVDLDLRGMAAYPILDRLMQRGIPFIIATALTRRDIDARYACAPCVSKPYDIGELRQAVMLASATLLPRANVSSIRPPQTSES
ncbi:response regulator [Rhodanobacter sp. L36]|uniref:response regulator n=1 Tax=Rhodanobacter sp. L36 TaxID=1747221 RepID=UPI00131C7D8E|nr:response regulator [Rhodanobacter sp. L36]